MKARSTATMAARWIACLVLLLAGGHVVAQDAWLRGQALFNSADKCIDCHSSTNKAGRSAAAIAAAISSQPCMNGTAVAGCASPTGAARNLTTLSPSEIDDIEAYLSTSRHASLAPTSHPFPDTPLSATPKPTQTFVLTSDGDATRGASSTLGLGSTTSNDTTNFSVNAAACTGPLPVGSSCNAVVTFTPGSAPTTPFALAFSVGHDGFDGGTSATASGKGLEDLEIATAGPLNFSVARPGTSAPQPLTIINRVSSDLRLCLIGAGSFPSPGDFTLVGRTLDPGPDRCATLASPGVTVIQNINFTPTADGPRFARLTAQRVGAGGVLLGPLRLLDLQGNAGAFSLVNKARLYSATRIDADGQTALDAVDLSSAGSATLTFTTAAPGGAFAISGGQMVAGSCTATPAANTGEYQVMPGGCTALASLPAFSGAPPPACTLTVRFDPSGDGPRCGILTISTNGDSHTVVLEGSGFFGPRLAVRDGTAGRPSPHSLDFTSQLLTGVSYPAKSLFLRNAGTLGNLELVLPAETAALGFAVRPGAGCASSMTPFIGTGPECQVDIFFLPTELRSYAGSIDILARPAGSSAPYTTYRVNLSGTGSNVAPELRWSSDRSSAAAAIGALDFGSVAFGIDPLPVARTVFLHNIGHGSARIDLLHAVGAEATSYRANLVGCTVGGFLAQGQSCEVTVEFLPATAGTKQAELRAVSTGNGPLGLPLQGSFSAGSLSPRLDVTATAAFDATRVGSRSNPVEVLLSNTSGFPVQVTGMVVNGPFAIVGGSCSAVPFALPPSSGCRVSLAFQPPGEGAASGTLEVTTDVSATPERTALSGQGEAAANLSSGGCSIASSESPADPTLWLLVAIAAAVLLARRREQRHGKR